eukprot:2858904-Pyramimonas_sp.AAC.1
MKEQAGEIKDLSQKMSKYRYANPNSNFSELWAETKGLPPVEQLISQIKLQDFYLKNICKSTRRITSTKTQEHADSKVQATLSYWEMCTKMNLSPRDENIQQEIDLAVKMGWVKQKKASKATIKQADDLGLPAAAGYVYIVCSSCSTTSLKKARTDTYEEEAELDAEQRDDMRRELFPMKAAKAKPKARARETKDEKKGNAAEKANGDGAAGSEQVDSTGGKAVTDGAAPEPL